MGNPDQLFELLDNYFQAMRAAWKRQEDCGPESPEFEAIQNELADELQTHGDCVTEHVNNLGRRRFGKKDWQWRYRDAEELVESQTDEGRRLLFGRVVEIDSAPQDLHSRVARRIASNIHHQLIEWHNTEWIAAVLPVGQPQRCFQADYRTANLCRN